MSEKTHAEIIAQMKAERPGLQNATLNANNRHYAGLLDAAHRREVEALKRRRSELSAEITAKDEVIKRLDDAIAEDQRRKMATAENSSTVGDCAKLREALCEILSYIETFHKYIVPRKREKTTALFAVADTIREKARAALAAPARECDRFDDDLQADNLHAAFVKYCNECDCPMGCIHRKEMEGLLDVRCASILKCFARFALSKASNETEVKDGSK